LPLETVYPTSHSWPAPRTHIASSYQIVLGGNTEYRGNLSRYVIGSSAHSAKLANVAKFDVYYICSGLK